MWGKEAEPTRSLLTGILELLDGRFTGIYRHAPVALLIFVLDDNNVDVSLEA
jgi:hypothetical protein